MANKKKYNKKSLIIAIIAMVIVVIILAIVSFFSSRGEKVPDNEPGTIGNQAGNINNGGIVCQHNDRIYFSNPYDGGALYSMNLDESDCKKISISVASSICAAGDYLYYFQSGSSGAAGLGGVRVPASFIRCHLDGSKGYTMTRNVVVKAQVVDNYVYAEGTADANHDAPYFFRMDIAAKEDEEILAKFAINPACVRNGSIYYADTASSRNLNAYSIQSGSTTTVIEDNVWNPVIYGDYIYYMAPGDGYQIRRYSLSDGTIEILCDEKVESFNVYGGYIYYQTFGDNAHIAFMSANGGEATVLSGGNYNSISMTDGYIYFKDFWNEQALYHTYPGSTYFEPVSAASDAALENIKAENEDKNKEE